MLATTADLTADYNWLFFSHNWRWSANSTPKWPVVSHGEWWHITWCLLHKKWKRNNRKNATINGRKCCQPERLVFTGRRFLWALIGCMALVLCVRHRGTDGEEGCICSGPLQLTHTHARTNMHTHIPVFCHGVTAGNCLSLHHWQNQ